jgi:SAM-dependent methyltransferase
MAFAAYLANVASKIAHDPRKLGRVFERRYWMHLYWMARFGSRSDLHASRWQFTGDFAHRNYRSYDEYVAQQAKKIEDANFRRKLESLEDEQYQGFRRRFGLAPEIVGHRTVLCLGARLGTEVRAFKDMDFFAVGIDLNPGGGNVHVLSGDFHRLAFADGTVDIVYTNVLDHAFDLEKVMGETRRVLSDRGIAFVEIIRGTDEGYLPQEYESIAWKTARGFADRLAEVGGMKLVAFRTHDQIQDPFWSQAVFTKN